MDTQIQHGYLVLADISGFTSFMEETEITHSSNILRDLIEQMGIRPDGAHPSQESYEHLGEIKTSSINLDERYQELIKRRRVFLSAAEADVSVSHEFAASPAVLWDWLIDLHKRTRWMKGSAWEVKERPHGRTGPAAQNHCTNSDVIEEILDWRPFDYYTVNFSKGFLNIMITVELNPAAGGTHLQWNIKLDGGLPRWIRRRLCRHLVAHTWKLDDNFNLMAQMIAEAGRTV